MVITAIQDDGNDTGTGPIATLTAMQLLATVTINSFAGPETSSPRAPGPQARPSTFEARRSRQDPVGIPNYAIAHPTPYSHQFRHRLPGLMGWLVTTINIGRRAIQCWTPSPAPSLSPLGTMACRHACGIRSRGIWVVECQRPSTASLLARRGMATSDIRRDPQGVDTDVLCSSYGHSVLQAGRESDWLAASAARPPSR
ncbi:hypothetical protein DENSPDRAFT_498061 [Dentipellis sp. KUC8613]|nr:hypothetical protein DENSPDRAFT_498061 [Dentipellis sp. KUC8613]